MKLNSRFSCTMTKLVTHWVINLLIIISSVYNDLSMSMGNDLYDGISLIKHQNHQIPGFRRSTLAAESAAQLPAGLVNQTKEEASYLKLHRCIDENEAYASAYLTTRTHLINQNTTVNLSEVYCETASFMMMNVKVKRDRDVPGSVTQTLDVLDYSVVHLSWYERLQKRYADNITEVVDQIRYERILQSQQLQNLQRQQQQQKAQKLSSRISLLGTSSQQDQSQQNDKDMKANTVISDPAASITEEEERTVLQSLFLPVLRASWVPGIFKNLISRWVLESKSMNLNSKNVQSTGNISTAVSEIAESGLSLDEEHILSSMFSFDAIKEMTRILRKRANKLIQHRSQFKSQDRTQQKYRETVSGKYLNRTLAIMPFLGYEKGSGNSDAENRYLYLEACFWSIYPEISHIVAFVKDKKDAERLNKLRKMKRKESTERDTTSTAAAAVDMNSASSSSSSTITSGSSSSNVAGHVYNTRKLPFFDVVVLKDLPQSAALPVAAVQETKARLLDGRWDFDYIYFTESDQVLIMRLKKEIYEHLERFPRRMLVPHRLVPYPEAVLTHVFHRNLSSSSSSSSSSSTNDHTSNHITENSQNQGHSNGQSHSKGNSNFNLNFNVNKPNEWVNMSCCLPRQNCMNRKEWKNIRDFSVQHANIFGLHVALGNVNFFEEIYRPCVLYKNGILPHCP